MNDNAPMSYATPPQRGKTWVWLVVGGVLAVGIVVVLLIVVVLAWLVYSSAPAPRLAPVHPAPLPAPAPTTVPMR